jgi:hypothetical protein
MSITQKTAWAQLGIFAALVIGWLVLFITNRTIFYWQDTTMKMTFYWMNAAALAFLVIMQLVAIILKRHFKAIVDERDNAIFRRATLWAIGVSYTIVIVLLVVLATVCMEKDNVSISVYFPLFIVLIGWATLSLTQAAAALIIYGRKVNHAEG